MCCHYLVSGCGVCAAAAPARLQAHRGHAHQGGLPADQAVSCGDRCVDIIYLLIDIYLDIIYLLIDIYLDIIYLLLISIYCQEVRE